MKKYVAFLLFLPILGYGQRVNDLSLQTTYSQVGVKLGCSITHHHSNKLAYTAGLNYLINRPVTDNQGYSFRHRFYATKPVQAIGIQLGIQRNISLSESALEPYFFYTLQGTHAPTRRLSQYIDSMVVNQPTPQTIPVIVSEYTIYPKSIWAIENILGLGFHAKIYKQWYLNAAAGFGPVLILMPSIQGTNGGYFRTIEIGDYYRIGISYRLMTKP